MCYQLGLVDPALSLVAINFHFELNLSPYGVEHVRPLTCFILFLGYDESNAHFLNAEFKLLLLISRVYAYKYSSYHGACDLV